MRKAWTIPKNTQTIRNEIKQVMIMQLEDDPGLTCTELAELFGEEHWLDDPEHWIWDVAVEAKEDQE